MTTEITLDHEGNATHAIARRHDADSAQCQLDLKVYLDQNRWRQTGPGIVTWATLDGEVTAWAQVTR